jgi:hypothetical protein
MRQRYPLPGSPGTSRSFTMTEPPAATERHPPTREAPSTGDPVAEVVRHAAGFPGALCH